MQPTLSKEGVAGLLHRPGALLAIGIASGLLLIISIALAAYYLLVWRKRERHTQVGSRAVTRKRLLSVWENFLAPLPPVVRAALPDYAHFIVLGDPGVGKSTAISRRVDWQGQASLFLPSYTPDPLLQIYLGSRTVVYEISATLLQSTSQETHEAFRLLWRAALSPSNPPTLVVVLKASTLSLSSPDVIRQQAQLIRGKLNLLSQLLATPLRTRLCITNMERLRGYSEFARFLHKAGRELVLDVGTDADVGLAATFQSYEKYLPRALSTLPVGPFEASVNLLSAAHEVITPVHAFIAALVEGSVASVRPDVQRVYFFSLPSDEQVGNPFDTTGLAGSAPTVLSRWGRRLRELGIRPLHALLCLLLLLAGLVPLFVAVRRHEKRVHGAATAVAEFAQAVRRAQESLSPSSESDVVRRAKQQAAVRLREVDAAETRFRPFLLLQRPEKASARQRFVESIRQAYLRPALEASVRQRSRDKILYALAALYATRGNTLGALVHSQPQEFSTTLGLPVDLVLDYVDNSEHPWTEQALLLLPPLPSESGRWPLADLRPWREFIQAVSQAVGKPYITSDQLAQLRKESERLLETLGRIQQAGTLRRIYQILSEESPLDLARLLGADAGALTPEPWLRDNAAALERLLRLVRESMIPAGRPGHLSLYQLLKWINSLSSADGPSGVEVVKGIDGKDHFDGAASGAAAGPEEARPADAAPASEDEPIVLAFPGSSVYELSARAWAELLLRSRKQLLLAYQLGHAERSHHRLSKRCCECGQHGKRRRRCLPCASGEGHRHVKKELLCSSHRHPGSRRALPLFEPDDLPSRRQPLYAAGPFDAPTGEEYNRAVFDREVLPLLNELKKAVASSRALKPEEKLKLARLVRSEVSGYARRYCAGLLKFHQSFHFPGGAPDLHSELLNLVRPGSRFIAHLSVVADNASLRELDDLYLRPLTECLSDFKPLVEVMTAKGADKGADKKADSKPAGGSSDREAPGLADYLAAVSKLAEELDASAAPGLEAPADDKKGAATSAKSGLETQLSPAGRSALASAQGQKDTPRHKAEEFLDKAGILGGLRRPFMEPFEAVYRRGARDIERTLAQHWQSETQPKVAQLLSRFPFNPAAEREVAPADLDTLNEVSGAFWQDLRGFFGPVLSEQGGVYRARSGAHGPLALPRDLLPTVNQLAQLSRALFGKTGARQPLRFAVRNIAGDTIGEGQSVQPAVAFLQVGKAAVYGFNQRASAATITIDWWDQGVATVGIESTAARSGRKHTQTLEVADSAWSLFRLLQKSTVEGDGISTWRLLEGGVGGGQTIRFQLQPDPWALFRLKLP